MQMNNQAATGTTKAAPNADGSVDIPLSKPLAIDGTAVDTLRMREPLVSDQLAVHGTGNDAEVELALIANLCMVSPDSLKGMRLRDYTRLRVVLLGFID